MNNFINNLAKLLTEDPNLTNSLSISDLNKPLSGLDIDKTTTNNSLTDPVDDQAKKQQDAQDEAQKQRQKLLQPQFSDMRQSLTKLDTGLLQNQQLAQQDNRQLTDLDKEIAKINTTLGSLEKTTL